MERNPKDKVVVVTGGARGIGFAIAEKFLQNGAERVIVLDINETLGIPAVKKLSEKYGEDKTIFIKCDVTKDLDTVCNMIFKKYKVDVFINNAGIVDETSPTKTFEVNITAVAEWGIKFWEHMRKDKGGSGGTILNTSSIFAYENIPFLGFYKTSKIAVIGFTRALGHPYNYEKSGVRVIAICPGYTDTDIINCDVWDWQKEDFDKAVHAQVLQSPERVGEAALEIFTVANSGSVWVAKDNKPIELAPVS